MMSISRTLICTVLASSQALSECRVCGWIRTRRDAKGFSFLEVNDGSCRANLQCIVDESSPAFRVLGAAGTGAAVALDGALVASPGKGQKWELRARELHIFGAADQAAFPLQKKRHSDEFLRTIAHLRSRTNKFGAVWRVRSAAAQAIHEFFNQRKFVYVHTPILTGSDCEGAGEMFRVTTNDGHGRLSDDFFGKPCNLTVSGQLEAEAMAMGLGRVYTFGPTFRAENSNTARHAAEFWMVEPEMAFADLDDDINLADELIRSVIRSVMERCSDDLELFNRFVAPGLVPDLERMASAPIARIPYAEAIRLLQASECRFEYAPVFGCDLQSEHERFLAEEVFRGPVAVYDYPKEIKAFYMRLNDDQQTVAAVDVLVPRIGELIGGSQREDRLDLLEARLAAMGQDSAPYSWYLDLRRFGSAPHAGFGLGFERLIMLLTGISNIRDVLPFPRTPGNLEF